MEIELEKIDINILGRIKYCVKIGGDIHFLAASLGGDWPQRIVAVTQAIIQSQENKNVSQHRS